MSKAKPAAAKKPAARTTKPKPKAAPARKKPGAPKKPRAATTRKKPATRAKPPPTSPGEDLVAAGVRVIGVTGPFGEITLLQVPTKFAAQMFRGLDLADAAPLEVIEAVARDVAAIRERDQALGDSALAAAALALAREIANPFNSATSKSMCAREMREHLDRLRELLPPGKEDDRLDEIAAAREARRARAAGGAGT